MSLRDNSRTLKNSTTRPRRHFNLMSTQFIFAHRTRAKVMREFVQYFLICTFTNVSRRNTLRYDLLLSSAVNVYQNKSFSGTKYSLNFSNRRVLIGTVHGQTRLFSTMSVTVKSKPSAQSVPDWRDTSQLTVISQKYAKNTQKSRLFKRPTTFHKLFPPATILRRNDDECDELGV